MARVTELSDSFLRLIEDTNPFSALLERIHREDDIPLSILRGLEDLSIEAGDSQATILREQLNNHLTSTRIHVVRRSPEAVLIHTLPGENLAAIGFLNLETLRSEYPLIREEFDKAEVDYVFYLKLTDIRDLVTLNTIYAALLTDSVQQASSSRPQQHTDSVQQASSSRPQQAFSGPYDSDTDTEPGQEGGSDTSSYHEAATKSPAYLPFSLENRDSTQGPITSPVGLESPGIRLDLTLEGPTLEGPTLEGPTLEIPSGNTAIGVENRDNTKDPDVEGSSEYAHNLPVRPVIENPPRSTSDRMDKDPNLEEPSGSRATGRPLENPAENPVAVPPRQILSRSRSTELSRLTSQLAIQPVVPGLKRARSSRSSDGTVSIYAKKQTSSKRTKGSKGSKAITGTSHSGTPTRSNSRFRPVLLRLHVAPDQTNLDASLNIENPPAFATGPILESPSGSTAIGSTSRPVTMSPTGDTSQPVTMSSIVENLSGSAGTATGDTSQPVTMSPILESPSRSAGTAIGDTSQPVTMFPIVENLSGSAGTATGDTSQPVTMFPIVENLSGSAATATGDTSQPVIMSPIVENLSGSAGTATGDTSQQVTLSPILESPSKSAGTATGDTRQHVTLSPASQPVIGSSQHDDDLLNNVFGGASKPGGGGGGSGSEPGGGDSSGGSESEFAVDLNVRLGELSPEDLFDRNRRLQSLLNELSERRGNIGTEIGRQFLEAVYASRGQEGLYQAQVSAPSLQTLSHLSTNALVLRDFGLLAEIHNVLDEMDRVTREIDKRLGSLDKGKGKAPM